VFLAKRPKKIISLGGYISMPVCFAAFILRIPIELFELNSSPGKAIKFLAPFAKTIYICFSKAAENLPRKKCKIKDYPLRFSCTQKNKKTSEKSNKTTILILGGSQGSITINTIFKKWLLENKKIHNNISIIHQTGTNDKTNWKAFYKKLQIPAISFCFKKNIKKYYQDSDIIICRSGAGTLFETIFFKKKCITIPLETINTSHQVDNAREIVKLYPKLVTMIRKNDIDENNKKFFHLLNKIVLQKYQN
jgi:UDP-N-acetylglucosamine--N-acetylmuramyl-(pentapeptide) pyrophosphoryl-undecaprenol N-acetylglucosamine transferase